MKNFQSYEALKYSSADYKRVSDGIYKTSDPYSAGKVVYVTSLTFEMEPESYGEEGGSPRNITQAPFEDILDKFSVYVTDFYDDLNKNSKVTCYQEFGSPDLEDIVNLRTLIGKRIYAVPHFDEDGEEEYYDAVIE